MIGARIGSKWSHQKARADFIGVEFFDSLKEAKSTCPHSNEGKEELSSSCPPASSSVHSVSFSLINTGERKEPRRMVDDLDFRDKEQERGQRQCGEQLACECRKTKGACAHALSDLDYVIDRIGSAG